MAERLTPEQLDALADGYAKGQDRSWWPECPESFREEWKRTEDALRFAARDARTLDRVQAWTETQPPKRFTDRNGEPYDRVPAVVDAEMRSRDAVAALLRAEEE